MLNRSPFKPHINSYIVGSLHFFASTWPLYQGIRLKTVSTKSEECGCARKRVTALLISHTFACSLAGKIIEKCMKIENLTGRL